MERSGTKEKTDDEEMKTVDEEEMKMVDDEEMKMVDEEERRALAAWRGWGTAALVVALVALAGAVAHFVAGCQ